MLLENKYAEASVESTFYNLPSKELILTFPTHEGKIVIGTIFFNVHVHVTSGYLCTPIVRQESVINGVTINKFLMSL